MAVTRIAGFLFITLLLLLSVPLHAQKSKSQLEKEKKENLGKISEAENILKQTGQKKRKSIGQLRAINQQIKVRSDLIRSINREINLLNSEIDENQQIIESLEEDLDRLMDEYAAMIYAAYKSNSGHNKLAFIFSSGSFNQFVRRVKYMKQYGDSRRSQVREINIVKEALGGQVTAIENRREEKNSLLGEVRSENTKLRDLKKQQNDVITDLAKRESDLTKEIADRKAANERLTKLIDEIIREEIARANRANNANNSNMMALTPEAATLSNVFAENRRKLSWPVQSGFISQKFGRQPHPVLKKIEIENRGIDIQTNENEQVRSVFDGVVSAVVTVPGMHNAVFVRHGEFLTVYANLKSVNVKQGQQVKAKDNLGEVFTDGDGISEIHFEIWKNKTVLNPQLWLHSR